MMLQLREEGLSLPGRGGDMARRLSLAVVLSACATPPCLAESPPPPTPYSVAPVPPLAGELLSIRWTAGGCAAVPLAFESQRAGLEVTIRLQVENHCTRTDRLTYNAWLLGMLPAGEYLFRFEECLGASCAEMQQTRVHVGARSLFDTLRRSISGDAHVRSWQINTSDVVEYAEAFLTPDPDRLLVRTSHALSGAHEWSNAYVSHWYPVFHAPAPADAIAVSADFTRFATGVRNNLYGAAVSVLDSGGATLLAVPSATFATGGSAFWPWLSDDGRSAVFTISNGWAPLAPNGDSAPMDGVVVWEEGANGLRPIGDPDAIVVGASGDLGSLVLQSPNGRVALLDATGTVRHELCAPAENLPQTCGFRGLSRDGRFVSVLDEGVVPPRRVLIDLVEGTEEPLPPRGAGSSWVAFDHAGTRMLYSRLADDGYDMVVRSLRDGAETILDVGPQRISRRPVGFVAEHFVITDGSASTFIDTRVISADGFDGPWQ